MIRQAQREDVAEMHRVRTSVHENRLTSMVLTEADYFDALQAGRAWVAEHEGQIVAFAAGNAVTGNIWALFVEPEYEGRGHGRELHNAMVTWLRSQGCRTLWLTTEPGTRAERFYASAGWIRTGITASGEVRFELTT